MFFGMTHLYWNEKLIGFNHANTQTILSNAQTFETTNATQSSC